MKNNPLSGFQYVLLGLKLISRPGLRRFVVIPLTINILVFSLLIWGGIEGFSTLMAGLLPEDSWWIHLEWLLWPLFAITSVLLVFYTFTVIANLIASPFNGLLAEKVEAVVAGQVEDQESGWKEMVRDIVPSILSELRKLGYFILRAIPLLILFLIPGINILAPFLWMAFSAWFLCLEYIDFPMGNHGIRFKDQHERMKTRRLKAMGFGGGLMLMMAVPGLNFLAMPTGVAGATAFWCREVKGETGLQKA